MSWGKAILGGILGAFNTTMLVLLFRSLGATNLPLLIEAGYDKLKVQVPWWDGKQLRFSFR